MGSSSSVQSGGGASSSGGGTPPTLYIHPFSAPCRAVLMVASAAEIKLDIKKVDLMSGEHMKEEFVKINPDHTVPTLVDGKFYLWESRAIMQYLVSKYGGKKITLYPTDIAQRALVDRWLQYDLGVAYKAISAYVIFKNQGSDEESEKEVEKVLDYLENTLKIIFAFNSFHTGCVHKHSKQPYVVVGGNLTIADLSLFSNLSLLETVDWSFDRWSAVAIWRETVKKQPWYENCNKGLIDYCKTKKFSMD